MRGRALVVLGETDPSVVCGATRSLLKAMPGVAEAGWELHFWTSDPSATADELRTAGHEVAGASRELKYSPSELRMPPGPLTRITASLAGLRAFGRHVQQLDPDLVVGNTVGTLPELIVAKRKRRQTLLHALEVAPPTRRHRMALRLLARVSDVVMVPAASTGRQFEQLGASPVIVHTGVEPPPRSFEPIDQAGVVVVGALGTISERKGTDLLIAAARRLLEGGQPVRIELAGEPIDGSERAGSERALADAAELGVVSLGRVDTWEALARWQILAMPSREDPFPNAVLEAMSAGVPVVGAAVGGIPDQLGADAGVLVEPGDPVALAEAIAGLAADPVRRAELGAAGRERARDRFSIEAQVAGTLAAFETAAAGPQT